MNNFCKIFLDFPPVKNSLLISPPTPPFFTLPHLLQNVPNVWTVKDGWVGGEISILFEKVEKSRKILQNLSKTFLSDQLMSYSLIIFNRPTYQLKFYFWIIFVKFSLIFHPLRTVCSSLHPLLHFSLSLIYCKMFPMFGQWKMDEWVER